MTDTTWPRITGEIPPFVEHPDRACAGQDTNLWFPEHGGTGRQAIAICRECPLIDACAAWSLEQPHLHGVWGGLSRTDRTKIRLGQPIKPVAIPATFRPPPGRKVPFASTVQVRAKVAAMFDDGHSIGDIADVIGRSYRTTQRHLRATGRSRTAGGRPIYKVAA